MKITKFTLGSKTHFAWEDYLCPRFVEVDLDNEKARAKGYGPRPIQILETMDVHEAWEDVVHDIDNPCELCALSFKQLMIGYTHGYESSKSTSLFDKILKWLPGGGE